MAEDLESEESPLTDNYKEVSSFDHYKESFRIILSSPRDLWTYYLIRFLMHGATYTYFSCLIVYLSNALNLSDTSISIVYFLFGMSLMMMIMTIGYLPDKYGIKISIFIAGTALAITFTLMMIFEDFYVQMFLIIILQPIGSSLFISSCDIGLKFYTHPNCRSLGITIAVIVTNLTTIVGALVIQLMFLSGSHSWINFRILFLYCAISVALAAILSLFLRNLDYGYRENEVITQKEEKFKYSSWDHLRRVFILKKFWRILGIMSLLFIIKSIFYQQTIILPIYMDRDLGDDSYYGLIIILNQVCMIIFLPLCLYSIYYFSSYDIFLISGVIAVISPLVFIFGASYLTIILHVVIMSVSESFLAPQAVIYCLSLAPKGYESIILGVLQLPFIFSAVFSGISGGLLLNSFCPKHGENNCWFAWVMTTVYTTPALLCLFIFRKFLEEPNFESKPYVSCSNESKLN